MIADRRADQCLQCTVCGKVVELGRRLIKDPEGRLLRLEQMEQDHARCQQLAATPGRARAEQKYRLGMRLEIERARAAGMVVVVAR